jgi:hypothetical protein
MGELNDLYKVVTGKPGERFPLGRSGYRWEGNIKRIIMEVRCRYVNQERVQ